MPVTTPPGINSLPIAPDPNDRATFNARAYPWSVALDPWTNQANALASWMYITAAGVENQANNTASLANSILNYESTYAFSNDLVAVGTGTKNFTIPLDKLFLEGQYVFIVRQNEPSTYMTGQVLSYNSLTGVLSVSVDFAQGSGSLAQWYITLGPRSDAAFLKNTPAGSVAATTVQDAINELDSEKFAKTGGDISGNVNITGTGRRITSNFGSGAVNTRTLFQTNSTNTQTDIVAVENGTVVNNSGAAQLILADSNYAATGTDYEAASVSLIKNAELRIAHTALGTASFRPVTFYTSNLERLRIDTGGNVGIGTGPTTRFHVYSANAGDPDATGTGTTGVTARFQNTEVNVDFGVYSGGHAWIQPRLTGNNSSTFNTHLNPVGGTVIPGPGGLLSVGPIGYGTGAGGTVTQATSKSTAVTLNKPSGQITMNAESLASGASVEFVLNNSLLSASDGLVVNPNGFTGYAVELAYFNSATQAVLRVTNRGAARSDAVVINFNIVKRALS